MIPLAANLPRRLRLTALTLLAAMAPGATGRAGETPTAAVFKAAAGFDFNQAQAALARLSPTDGARETELAAALLLITTSPQTDVRLDEAARRLAALALPPAADAVAAEAAYQRARLADTRHASDSAALLALYRDVWTRFPGTLPAERAFVFAAIVRQHQLEAPEAKRAALLALDAEAGTQLRSLVARRLYHLTASMAWGRLLQDEERACAHLLVVHELGLASEYAFSDVVFRLGEYHRRRGDAAAAARFFTEFVTRYPTDRRTDLARRLAAAASPDGNPTR